MVEATQQDFQQFIAAIRKEAKDETLLRGMNEDSADIPRLKTGIAQLDKILGGGIPKGRIVEVYGPESSGKTTLILQIIAASQTEGGTAVFIDAENALDRRWAQKLGVNLDYIAINQPDYGEQAYNLIDRMLDMPKPPDIIVVDSLPAMMSKKIMDADADQDHVGTNARMHAKSLPKFFKRCEQKGTIIFLINQVREKISGFTPSFMGPAETTPGGRMVRHAASVRIKVRKGEPIKSGGKMAGMKIMVKTVKNKTAAPAQDCEFTIMYEDGIDNTHDLFVTALEKEILERKGGWYYYGDYKWQGQDSVMAAIKEDPLLKAELEEAILEDVEDEE